MEDGLGDLGVLGEPPPGETVQLRDVSREGAAQLQPEQAAEHVVVAEPGAAGVQRHHERVGVLQVQQDPFRPGGPGQQVGQLAIDPVQQGGAQQQALHLRRLPVQQLSHQVLSDRTVTAGELGHEAFRVRVPVEGQGRQPQSSRPAFGPLVQHGDHRVGQRNPGGGQQPAGLVFGEAQLRGADLGQLPGQPELVQAQRGVAAGGHDRMDARGEAHQQRRELLGGLGGAQLVQVIDDQDERTAGRRELGQHLVHHRLAVEPGRRGRGLGAAGRGADRAQQCEPEQLRVVLAPRYGDEGNPAVLGQAGRPRHAAETSSRCRRAPR